MSSNKIKLVYFHFMARAELSRLILAQAEVNYEDVRIEMDDWPNHKPSKFGSKIRNWNKKLIADFIDESIVNKLTECADTFLGGRP